MSHPSDKPRDWDENVSRGVERDPEALQADSRVQTKEAGCVTTMQGGGLLEARRDQARRHPLRLAILALSVQGKSLDPKSLRRELPTHPALAAIKYHLLVLKKVELLP